MLWAKPASLSKELSVKDEFLVLCGFRAIASSVYFYSENSPFPELWALLPCLGAITIIYTRHTRRKLLFRDLSHVNSLDEPKKAKNRRKERLKAPKKKNDHQNEIKFDDIDLNTGFEPEI